MSLSAGIGNDGAPQAPVQLVVYGFAPGARFEGQLVGALERLESGGALRVVDVLFVAREAETDELRAIGLHGKGAGGMVASLLGFRLDATARRRSTERALADEDVQALGRALAPGAAFAAVLVDHVWHRALSDAVARTGGTQLSGDFVEAGTLAELTDRLLAAAMAR
jgi:hypothetical protein